MPKKEKSPNSPSKEFMQAVCYSGTDIINCDLCGRVNFSLNSGFEDHREELEGLKRKAEKNPGKYAVHEEDSIGWGVLDGKQVVDGCPCNLARTYEDFFWNNRHVIAEYFDSRTKTLLDGAQRDSKLAEGVRQSVERS